MEEMLQTPIANLPLSLNSGSPLKSGSEHLWRASRIDCDNAFYDISASAGKYAQTASFLVKQIGA
jgi:hypothetical protein